eukprot:scaffold90583_cov14-Prasinocladus_malaysianus.AAC.1
MQRVYTALVGFEKGFVLALDFQVLAHKAQRALMIGSSKGAQSLRQPTPIARNRLDQDAAFWITARRDSRRQPAVCKLIVMSATGSNKAREV